MKILIFLFLSCKLFASYENLSVGYIDEYYKDKLSKKQLENILKNIKTNFESTLGFEVFGLSLNGKPVNIIYMPPSKTKLSINELQKILEKKLKKIQNQQGYFSSRKDIFLKKENELKELSQSLNEKIKKLNNYISQMNQKKFNSKQEFEKVQAVVNKQKKEISFENHKYELKRLKYNDLINSYNQKYSLYNANIREFNRLQRKLEVLIRSSKEIKGAAIGYKKITFESEIKNGKLIQKKDERNYMEKIEIYGFESLDELEVILAHEIAHMVGVDHINQNGALMNPVLQKNQIGNLHLTPWDIKAFKEAF